MRTRRGFTLLEILLGLTLTTLLMVGVLAVVTDLGTRGLARPGEAGGDSDDVVDALVRLLREDLVSASVETVGENELSLTGYAHLDSACGERVHRPVRVDYRLERRGGRGWLVRRQAALDVLHNRGVQEDLVCGGVERFELTRVGQVGSGGAKVDASAGGGWRLCVRLAGPDAREYDRMVVAQYGGGL